MQRIPLLILAFIITIVTAKVPAFSEDLASRQNRYQHCLGKEPCITREDLRVMNELMYGMWRDLQRIEKLCAKTGYKDCFNPITNDVAEWYKTHKRLGDIARTIGQRPISANGKNEGLNSLEPSAGPVSGPNPYTNPDQERLNKNKRDWWQGEGWMPHEESNPYHKW